MFLAVWTGCMHKPRQHVTLISLPVCRLDESTCRPSRTAPVPASRERLPGLSEQQAAPADYCRVEHRFPLVLVRSGYYATAPTLCKRLVYIPITQHQPSNLFIKVETPGSPMQFSIATTCIRPASLCAACSTTYNAHAADIHVLHHSFQGSSSSSFFF